MSLLGMWQIDAILSSRLSGKLAKRRVAQIDLRPILTWRQTQCTNQRFLNYPLPLERRDFGMCNFSGVGS